MTASVGYWTENKKTLFSGGKIIETWRFPDPTGQQVCRTTSQKGTILHQEVAYKNGFKMSVHYVGDNRQIFSMITPQADDYSAIYQGSRLVCERFSSGDKQKEPVWFEHYYKQNGVYTGYTKFSNDKPKEDVSINKPSNLQIDFNTNSNVSHLISETVNHIVLSTEGAKGKITQFSNSTIFYCGSMSSEIAFYPDGTVAAPIVKDDCSIHHYLKYDDTVSGFTTVGLRRLQCTTDKTRRYTLPVMF
jgi:hypothetical protein